MYKQKAMLSSSQLQYYYIENGFVTPDLFSVRCDATHRVASISSIFQLSFGGVTVCLYDRTCKKCLEQIYSPIPGQKLRNVGYGGEKGGGSWFYSGIELYTNIGTFGTQQQQTFRIVQICSTKTPYKSRIGQE